jgi:VIT1/CCC1 family predicted Fe2+/Mn2+ transporter
MGISFLIAASIPIIPYFILEGTKSIVASILATLLSLFVLGLVKGIFVKKALFKSGAEVFLIGLISASVGYGLGEFIPLVLATLL